MHAPDPDTVTVREGAPRFWRRVWSPEPPSAAMRAAFPPNTAFIPMPTPMDEPLVIYGYAAESPYAEDKPVADRAWEQGQNFGAWCFSVACPDGEWGFTPVSAVEAITREEFEAARARGWR